jgi:hypothetical protein
MCASPLSMCASPFGHSKLYRPADADIGYAPTQAAAHERPHEELNRPELRAEAAEALRALIDEVRLIPEHGELAIELLGDLAGILALSADSKKPITAGRDGLQATLVAGVGFEPTTFRL